MHFGDDWKPSFLLYSWRSSHRIRNFRHICRSHNAIDLVSRHLTKTHTKKKWKRIFARIQIINFNFGAGTEHFSEMKNNFCFSFSAQMGMIRQIKFLCISVLELYI